MATRAPFFTFQLGSDKARSDQARFLIGRVAERDYSHSAP
jgi:hypothetical protein